MGIATGIGLALLLGQNEPKLPQLGTIKKWINLARAPKWSDYRGKVVIIYSYPTLCCGFDVGTLKVTAELKRYPGKIAAIGVVTLPYNEEHQKELQEVFKTQLIDWPLAFDEDEVFTNQFFPNDAPRNTYTLIDKNGKRVGGEPIPLDGLQTAVKELFEKR